MKTDYNAHLEWPLKTLFFLDLLGLYDHHAALVGSANSLLKDYRQHVAAYSSCREQARLSDPGQVTGPEKNLALTDQEVRGTLYD
jgi:hypothetical protein